jgi:hypothetical protein
MDKGVVMWNLADTHSGSTVGLMLPEKMPLVDGGYYTPSFPQDIIWKQFEEDIRITKKLRRNKNLFVVVNGDPVEGLHHSLLGVISPRVIDHESAHVRVMKYALKKVGFDAAAGDKIFYVGGTPSHCGRGNISTNRISAVLKAEPKDLKREIFWHGVLKLYVNGVCMIYGHQVFSASSRTWLWENNVRYFLKSYLMDCVGDGVDVPDYMVGAHRHRYVDSGDVIWKKWRARGIITPSYQGKTDWVYKVLPIVTSDVGSSWIIISKNGDHEHVVNKVEVEQDKGLVY